MKSKFTALAACLLLGGLASLASAQVFPQRRCGVVGGAIVCNTAAQCHCISGLSNVSPTVTASWCRDRGPTC